MPKFPRVRATAASTFLTPVGLVMHSVQTVVPKVTYPFKSVYRASLEDQATATTSRCDDCSRTFNSSNKLNLDNFCEPHRALVIKAHKANQRRR